MAHHHGGSMSGMSMPGMDGDGFALFTPTNIGISKAYWKIIGSFVGFGLLLNILHILSARIRKWQKEARSVSQPTVPNNYISQSYATFLTVFREISYPQGVHNLPRGLRWLTPPSLGKSLVIIVYWLVIIAMLTSNSIIKGAYYYEKLAFRAAWVSVMQVPFVFILAGKINIIGILIGSSYERLNWLHRWVARTLFVCITLHGAMFFAEWIRADFVRYQLGALPMVKFGIGAWAVLLWMNITSLLPVRSVAYEVFVIQHIISAVMLIWLLYMHIPDYAMHFLWMSVAFLVFDRSARIVWSLYRNIRFRSVPSKKDQATVGRIGYPAKILALPGDVTQVSIENVPFTWHAGQHIYLWVPRIGMIESHPFTIANACKKNTKARTIQLAVRAHSGFSRRLYHTAQKAPHGEAAKIRAFIQGPFGSYPDWNTYESLLLISASTGASFTLPILESVINDPCCVRRVVFLLLVRHRPQCTCYLGRLRRAAAKAQAKGIELELRIAITGSQLADDDASVVNACTCGAEEEEEDCCCGGEDIIETASIGEERLKQSDASISSFDNDAIYSDEKAHDRQREQISGPSEKRDYTLGIRDDDRTSSSGKLQFSSGKYQVSHTIRRTVEEAYGETCVAVCGGQRLTGDVRNAVAILSDERAVHKGSGAQGIYLHVEEFGL